MAVNAATKEFVEAKVGEKSAVSGTHDGTNWTKITIDGVEKNIPEGGGGGGGMNWEKAGTITHAKEIQVGTSTWTTISKWDAITTNPLASKFVDTAYYDILLVDNTSFSLQGSSSKAILTGWGYKYTIYLYNQNNSDYQSINTPKNKILVDIEQSSTSYVYTAVGSPVTFLIPNVCGKYFKGKIALAFDKVSKSSRAADYWELLSKTSINFSLDVYIKQRT